MITTGLYYSLTMLAALLIGAVLLRRSQSSLPISKWQKLGLGVGAFTGAMIGAKLPFLLSDIDGVLDGSAWFSHGKTIMCGIVGAYFGVEVAKWSLGVRIKTGDSFAVPVAVAVAVGRVACFFGGCCFGRPTELPWGVVFSNLEESSPITRHPTQLYEATFHFVAAFILAYLQSRKLLRGQLIKLYIVSYLVFRFATEFIRPEQQIMLGMTGYQWAALALAPLFLWLWVRDDRAFKNRCATT